MRVPGAKGLNRQRLWLVLVAWMAQVILSCGGCESRSGVPRTETSAKSGPEWEAVAIPLEPDPPRQGNRLMELAGEVDVGNLYMAAVKVTALSGGEEVMACSGTAISPRVVLTAGHCVCKRKQAGMIDASECSEAAKVETVFYKPPVEEATRSSGSQGKTYHGRVEPHPELRILMDAQGRVTSSRADLALIILSKPLETAGVPLADEEVRLGESVIIVGHEYDEAVDVFGGERRFSRNEVTRLRTAEDERVLIRQPQSHLYRQDSGGPCVRQETKGPVLVGISSRWLGQGAAFTSIHDYRGWLRDVIQRAEMPASVPR